MSSKKKEAQAWVAGYSGGAGALGALGVIPGTTTVSISGMQITMAYHIGRIYRGNNFGFAEATAVCLQVGLNAIVGRLMAYELIGLLPIAGWAIKSGVAGSVTAIMGNTLIDYFEKFDPGSGPIAY
ncbi:hypothetical protein NIES25_35220 [Nostoc linckia NIES-25]|nr:hypothetical protein NIES25_35220 [Nostoc linckia NIES-25]